MLSQGLTVDNYLESVASPDARAALADIRRILKETLPEAEEKISYGMPAFKVEGMIVCYAAFKNHCSLFPGYVPDGFEPRLKGFKVNKGTIQFDPKNPLPEDLVRDIVLAKLAQYREKRAAKKA